jgi:hypothetical protein
VRRPKLALIAAAGLAAMTLLTAAPALAAAKPTTPTSAVQTPNGVKFDPSKAKCSTVPQARPGTVHQPVNGSRPRAVPKQPADGASCCYRLRGRGARRRGRRPQGNWPTSGSPAAQGRRRR